MHLRTVSLCTIQSTPIVPYVLSNNLCGQAWGERDSDETLVQDSIIWNMLKTKVISNTDVSACFIIIPYHDLICTWKEIHQVNIKGWLYFRVNCLKSINEIEIFHSICIMSHKQSMYLTCFTRNTKWATNNAIRSATTVLCIHLRSQFIDANLFVYWILPGQELHEF